MFTYLVRHDDSGRAGRAGSGGLGARSHYTPGRGDDQGALRRAAAAQRRPAAQCERSLRAAAGPITQPRPPHELGRSSAHSQGTGCSVVCLSVCLCVSLMSFGGVDLESSFPKKHVLDVVPHTLVENWETVTFGGHTWA